MEDKTLQGKNFLSLKNCNNNEVKDDVSENGGFMDWIRSL